MRKSRFTTEQIVQANGWEPKFEKSLSLGDDSSAELASLSTFLASALSNALPTTTGEYRVLGAREFDGLRDILRGVRQADSPQKLKYLRAILGSLELGAVAGDDWVRMFQHGTKHVNQTIAATARLVVMQHGSAA